jgi:hypothetical protein
MKINKRFQTYINEKNFMFILRNEPVVTFPLSQKNVDYLAGRLSSDLSPENLACDGEISPSKARAKGKALGNVVKDLTNYCQKNGLRNPTIMY